MNSYIENFKNDNLIKDLENQIMPFISTNIFELMTVNEKEERHSDMLAWLLKPEENHGLGRKVLDQFLNWIDNHEKSQSKIFKNKKNEISFTIKREYGFVEKERIDILLVSEKSKNAKGIVIGIENKWHSDEGKQQLDTYYTRITEEFPNEDYETHFVYLTLDKGDDQDKGLWLSLEYADALNWIEPHVDLYDKSVLAQYTVLIMKKLGKYPQEIICNCQRIKQKYEKILRFDDGLYEEFDVKYRSVIDTVNIVLGREDKSKLYLYPSLRRWLEKWSPNTIKSIENTKDASIKRTVKTPRSKEISARLTGSEDDLYYEVKIKNRHVTHVNLYVTLNTFKKSKDARQKLFKIKPWLNDNWETIKYQNEKKDKESNHFSLESWSLSNYRLNEILFDKIPEFEKIVLKRIEKVDYDSN